MKPHRIPHGAEPSPCALPTQLHRLLPRALGSQLQETHPALRTAQSRDLSPGSRGSHSALFPPGRTTTSLYGVQGLGFAPALPPLLPGTTRSRSVPAPLPRTTRESCCSCGREGSLGQHRQSSKICFNAPFYFCHLMASHVTPGRHLNVHPTLMR